MIYKPRWHNVFGEEVDLDNIDKRYAANILGHIASRSLILCDTGLVAKLEDVAENSREPNLRDRLRAVRYNIRCMIAGLPFRAPVL